MMSKYLLFLAFACSVTLINSKKFDTVYEWKYVDYLWESDAQKTAAVQSGRYNYTRPIIIDVDHWKGGNRRADYFPVVPKTFVTVVRRSGVPASLTTVSDQNGPGGPLLKPYPNWSWAAGGDCSTTLTNVYRVAIDECDRLWVMDNGMDGDERRCPAQLLSFDLHTDTLITQFRIPDSVSQNTITKRSLLVTPIVQTEGYNCAKTHVYMGDVEGHALVVYNDNTRVAWRLESRVYAPQPSKGASDFTIAGETFNMDDGVLGMALTPPINPQHRQLIFRPLSSFDMVSITTESLQNSKQSPATYGLVSNVLPAHAAAMAFSKNGVLFFGLMEKHSILCWNMRHPLTETNMRTVDVQQEYYQFVSGMKVVPSGPPTPNDELWMAISKYQKIKLGTQNFDEVNFRVMKQKVNTLLEGTLCNEESQQQPSQTHYNPGQSSYNPQQSSYNPQQSSYNPQQSSYNPQQSSYNPQQSSYNPQQSSNNPQQSSYNPQQFFPGGWNPYYNPSHSSYHPIAGERRPPPVDYNSAPTWPQKERGFRDS